MSIQVNRHRLIYSSAAQSISDDRGLVRDESDDMDTKRNDAVNKLSNSEEIIKSHNYAGQWNENNIIVQLSEDARNIMQGEIQKGYSEMNEEAIKKMEERNALFQEVIQHPGQDLPRKVGNIRTDLKLKESLEGMNQNTVKAVWSIIDTDLLPYDIGHMTEEERQELIALGMEKAKYLAKDMGDQASLFLEAMEETAKYGMNGKADETGHVTYQIQWGPPIGAPDDYISTSDLVQRFAPKAWEKHLRMCQKARETKDARLARAASEYLFEQEELIYKHQKKEVLEVKSQYASWKKRIENTSLKKIYDNVDRTNEDSFLNSIERQTQSLSANYLRKNIKEFMRIFSNGAG